MLLCFANRELAEVKHARGKHGIGMTFQDPLREVVLRADPARCNHRHTDRVRHRAREPQVEAVYWSRSRGKLWRKGEESGYVQRVVELRMDCDSDAILLRVEQAGGIACHTGRERCFFHKLEQGKWVETDPVLRDPALIYGKK